MDAIWWVKELTRAALGLGLPHHQLEAYLSHDQTLKNQPLSFAPFNGISSRTYQQNIVASVSATYRFQRLVTEIIEPRTTPLVFTGTRWTEAFNLIAQAREDGLPIRTVWVRRPENPTPLTTFEQQPGLYPPRAAFDAIVTNPTGNPHDMLRQLCRQLPLLDELTPTQSR